MTKRLSMVGLLTFALMAAVHPEATLRSSVKSVEAGHEMPVTGELFTAGDPVQLVLQSAMAEYDLISVTPEEGGVFAIDLEIPSNVRPGEYRLVSVAGDGEVTARLDVTILAFVQHDEPEEAGHDGGDEADHDEGMAMGEMAKADEVPIERSRAGMEWGVIGLLIGLAGGAGFAMLKS
jgi:hypothetical protein